MRKLLIVALLRFVRRLRFKQMVVLAGGLFLLTLLFPDPIPLLDEILLGLTTLLLSRWKIGEVDAARKSANPPIDLPPGQYRRQP